MRRSSLDMAFKVILDRPGILRVVDLRNVEILVIFADHIEKRDAQFLRDCKTVLAVNDHHATASAYNVHGIGFQPSVLPHAMPQFLEVFCGNVAVAVINRELFILLGANDLCLFHLCVFCFWLGPMHLEPMLDPSMRASALFVVVLDTLQTANCFVGVVKTF